MGLDEEEISIDSHYKNDLGCDSLLLSELIMSIEDLFGLIISDADAESLETVGGAVDYIYARLQAGS